MKRIHRDSNLLENLKQMKAKLAALDHTSDHDTAIATVDYIETLGEQMVRTEAKTLEGLCAKAQATGWAIEFEFDLLDPTKEESSNTRLAASIIRDLLVMSKKDRQRAN
jgi:hypothetical protein